MSSKTKKIIQPAKLFCGILINKPALCDGVKESLSAHLGTIDYISEPIAFNETDYYTQEMGSDLMRYWVFFENFIEEEDLAEIKNITNSIEESYAINSKRQVNIDPGFVTPAKVVLASAKNYIHRIYIGKSIFAEVTLYFKDQSFRVWPWTYPDYAKDETIKLFNTIRKDYFRKLQLSLSKKNN